MKLTPDVTIAGGGLAGLGLAYQIKSGSPDIDIVVIDKRQFPVPRAITKVGESSVEIGSRYLAKHLDLAEHLTNEHLKKFGIRIFFGEPAEDFSEQDELGASQVFGIPTYQIDRGDIENHLYDKVVALGVKFIDGADILDASIEPEEKTILAKTSEHDYEIKSRWLLDASGRHALIKNKLDLAKDNGHSAHAVWFRIDKRIDIDEWTECPQWRKRCTPEGTRWLSTNHLIGPGYWVWIIPLASGVTSIGIVMDDQALEEANIDSEESAITWLKQHQKRLAQAMEGANFLDFVVLNDYSYSCKQLFSDDKWAITGEAGLFGDPFYSPGSDFIAINNCFISELVQADMRGEDTRFRRALYEKLHFSIYHNTLTIYDRQYGGFGDRQMMGIKLLWDYSYYWGVLSLLFFKDALTDTDAIRKINPLLHKAQMINQEVQEHFRERAAKRQVLPNRGEFMDQYKVPCLQHFNEVLMDEDKSNLESSLQSNINMLENIAESVIDMLKEDADLQISDKEKELLGDYRTAVLS